MANYYENARTNYVKVKDPEEFKKWAKRYCALVEAENDGKTGKFCLLWNDGFNDTPYDDNDDEMEGSFFPDVAEHLVDGEVLVLVASGHENLRYITGYAQAINSKGDIVGISIDDIYQKAAEEFNVPVGTIPKAEY